MHTKERPSHTPAGMEWWRFSRYEVKDGYLAPADGATYELYDPWEARNAEHPHLELRDLVRDIKISPEKPLPTLLPAQEQRVLEWSAKYGPLGVALHEALALRLAERWAPPQPDSPRSRLIPRSTSYHRLSYGWKQLDVAVLDGRNLLDQPEREGSLVETPSDQWKDGLSGPVAVYQDIGSGQVQSQPLASYLHRFFPTVPRAEADSYGYPLPNSPEFRQMYREPLGIFLRTASLVAEAVDFVAELGGSSVIEGSTRRDGARSQLLAALVGQNAPVLYFSEIGPLEVRWSAHSLIAASVLKAVIDAQKAYLRRCSCGKLFYGKSPKAQYCSTKCMERVRKQRYRSRVSDEERLG